ncbi:MAG: helix-turn-helix domain-containing protein [Clostridia bacterium]|nr:helix-turn-helix domain-containing protein [Clostridia bacterium]
MNNSICRFVANNQNQKNLDTINFVLEVNPKKEENFRRSAVYSINYVTDGKGEYILNGRTYQLSKGDLFFVFPSSEYCIRSIDSLKYGYVSYLGLRAVYLMDKFNISRNNPVFYSYHELDSIWKTSIVTASDITLELLCECLFLYSLSAIGKNIEKNKTQSKNYNDLIDRIKLFVNENFQNPKLNLSMIATHLNYSNKYLSNAFISHEKKGIAEYICSIRINHALTLIERGLTSVKDIAFSSGFNDQFYFSKTFKKLVGFSPKAYANKRKLDSFHSN